jgi:palmitoyltransferase
MLMHRFGCLDHTYRVGGTIFLIAFLVYVPQIFIVWPWYGREISTDLLKLLVPFK